MATTIPVVTKEEIWDYKSLNYIYNERYPNLAGVTTAAQEAALDLQVTEWLEEAQGFMRGAIIETYHQYIDTLTWRVIFKMFCKWQSIVGLYSIEEQQLVDNAYIALVDYVSRISVNVTAQAELNVIPNHHSNMQFFNES